MKRFKWSLLLSLLVATGTQAAEKKLKVYLSADMEGIGGVSNWALQSSKEGKDYEKFRRLMTLEVNAAVGAAFEAGATEVLVSDSHGSGVNLDPELLDKRVRVVRDWPRPLVMMQGIDSSFDAVLLVGYHASAGQAEGILGHSMSSRKIFDLKLNGTLVSEAAFNAAVAGEFGVPVLFLSGDQVICEQAKALLGPIETAAVKQAGGFFSGTMIHPERSQALIREGTKRALSRRPGVKPYRLGRPVKLEITFKDAVVAEVVSFLPNVERLSGRTVVFTGGDILQVSRFLAAIMYLVVP